MQISLLLISGVLCLTTSMSGILDAFPSGRLGDAERVVEVEVGGEEERLANEFARGDTGDMGRGEEEVRGEVNGEDGRGDLSEKRGEIGGVEGAKEKETRGELLRGEDACEELEREELGKSEL